MGDQEEAEVVASGMALQQVSAWLGVDAETVLAQETDPTVEAMFTKPHPSLLGLGAKYLSHKSMEASGLELRLKHKLRKSADADGEQQYQPAQLQRHHQHKRAKHEPQQQGNKVGRHLQQVGQASDGSSDSDDEGGGKLGRLQQPAAPAAAKAAKVLDRSQLLQVPQEQLSKWQRKRLREKAKKQQQQNQQQQQQQSGLQA